MNDIKCIYSVKNHHSLRHQRYWNGCLILNDICDCEHCSFFKDKDEWEMDEVTFMIRRKDKNND